MEPFFLANVNEVPTLITQLLPYEMKSKLLEREIMAEKIAIQKMIEAEVKREIKKPVKQA